MPPPRHAASLVLIGLILLTGCATRPPAMPAEHRTPVALVPVADAGIEDRRSQFRRLFCSVNAELRPGEPEYLPCEQALVRFDGEKDSRPVAPLSRVGEAHVAVVMGLGWECLNQLLDPERLPAAHLRTSGYRVTEIHVDGLSGSARNAEEVAAALQAIDTRGKPLVVFGYSKGAVDVLEAVAAYPDVADRVAAVVSLAGSIGGSPLAEEVPGSLLNWLAVAPGSHCAAGDGKALESLRPGIRQRWLAQHPLPPSVRYYTLVTAPDPERVSNIMRIGQQYLDNLDRRNDGNLLPHDQLIPGGVLLGYVNADHWAVALPVAQSNRLLGATLVNHNTFPRNAVWEAAIRYVEWDLDHARP